MAFGSGRGSGNEARWEDVDWSSCAEVLAACADSGALITLGRSRDGGALSLGYVHGGKKDRDWANDPADIPELLYELHKVLVPDAASGSTSSAPPAGDQPVARRGRARAT